MTLAFGDDGAWPHAIGPLLNPLRLRSRRLVARLPELLAEFVLFGLKQAWACLFAVLTLTLLVGTHLIWQPVHTLRRRARHEA